MRIRVLATSLALNIALLRVQKEYGSDYAEDCSMFLQAIDYHFTKDGRNKQRLCTEELPSLIRQLKEAIHEPTLRKELEHLGLTDIESRLEALAGRASEVYEAGWVSSWKEKVLRCFRGYRHLVRYAHRKLTNHLGLELEEPSVLIAAPMPFGWEDALYDDSKDLIVFLTTGVRPRPELYTGSDGDPDGYLYSGNKWPPKYADMVFISGHEVAHRCLVHLRRRKGNGRVPWSYEAKELEEELCDFLAVRVMLSRSRFDRRLTKGEAIRRLSSEL